MRASVVIPVWNGASVVTDCLDALHAHCGDELLEVICVDNASDDESAALIANHHPHVRLIRQPVNLGFAGGVNAGIDVAQGDVLVLLNQDCVVQPGWLAALLQALEAHPESGIAGCTVFNPDGTLNHTGAIIQRPDVLGVHLTDAGDGQIQSREYVTGAAFAIRRQTWTIVGRFDEGYYPGYFEESDYCYRARRKGIETAYVPQARVTHLSNSSASRFDPIKHTANQHRSRYRFVSKHFDSREVGEFFKAECAAVETERYFAQAVGRTMAARDTLRNLADIIERRKSDLGEALSPVRRCQLQVGWTKVLHRSFLRAEGLGQEQLWSTPSQLSPLFETWQMTRQRVEATDAAWQAANQSLQTLQQREHDLLTRLLFRSPRPDDPEPILRRIFRLLVLRPLSSISGRDGVLLAELADVLATEMEQRNQMHQREMDQISHRLALLEILTDYDYR